MGVTGRYDFTGIQKAIGVGINAVLATTTWGAWLLASPFMPAVQAMEDAAVNFLANRGLIVLNIGAIMVDGSIDQSRLDSAINDALTKLQQGRSSITPAQGQAIDTEVENAFDQDATLGATNASDSKLPNVPNPPI